MKNEKYNIELINAVSDLYRRKVVSMDKDIVEKMAPYKKNTVSGYIKGTVKASDTFLKRFEEVFELKLANYANNVNQPLALGEINITVADYIAKLEGWNLFLQGITSSNLTDLLRGQQTIYALARAGLIYQVLVANGENTGTHEDDLGSLDKAIVEGAEVDLRSDKALSLRK